jgi:hypothetical protein
MRRSTYIFGSDAMSPDRPTPAFSKSPPVLVAAFDAALREFPLAERRQMFGDPAAFANGNLWTSLHGGNWVVRLPEAARAELLALPGAGNFEPMPGRPMTGFATLPPSVRDDPAALRGWLTRAWEGARAMPPKRVRAKRG